MKQRELIGRLQTMAADMHRLVDLARNRAEARRRKAGRIGGVPVPLDLSDVNLELLSTLASHSLTALKNAILYEEARQQVVADDLTKLYNFRYFHQRLVEEWKRSQRHRLPMGLIMADLDNFKRVNDQHGHATGNAVLARVADAIQKSVREIDVVARYGGEEFALILPQTPLSSLHVVAERIRRNVEDVEVMNGRGRRICVTISIGYDGWPGKVRSPGRLLERADAALRKAKRLGRNRSIQAP
jgi:diguanylate cyclase (GGDEF)-like protein